MTDEDHLNKNKTNEDNMDESDIEDEEDIYSDDKNNVTTDDEFYTEMMSVPAEHEDCLIPDGCKDELQGIEHLTCCLNRRYNASPMVFTGTLKEAIKTSFYSKDIKERRPLLIYVNHDKSLYSNLFCKQLLCHEKIIDFLLNNYVLWAWDVTFPSNGEKLNDIYKTSFSQWNIDQTIGTKSIEQYPLLIGILRHNNSDYIFKNLINGTDKRPGMDEFLARLIQHKDQFDDQEANYEKEKLLQYEMNNRLYSSEHFHPSSILTTQPFSRSTSMFSQNRNPYDLTRFLSHHNPSLILSTPFQHINLHDDDDENDEIEQTPTVENSQPKFSK